MFIKKSLVIQILKLLSTGSVPQQLFCEPALQERKQIRGLPEVTQVAGGLKEGL